MTNAITEFVNHFIINSKKTINELIAENTLTLADVQFHLGASEGVELTLVKMNEISLEDVVNPYKNPLWNFQNWLDKIKIENGWA